MDFITSGYYFTLYFTLVLGRGVRNSNMVLKDPESRAEQLTSQMVLCNVGRKIHILAICNAQRIPEL